jgi:hypothetical protein
LLDCPQKPGTTSPFGSATKKSQNLAPSSTDHHSQHSTSPRALQVLKGGSRATVKLMGWDITELPPTAQFSLCAGGVLICYLSVGVLQVVNPSAPSAQTSCDCGAGPADGSYTSPSPSATPLKILFFPCHCRAGLCSALLVARPRVSLASFSITTSTEQKNDMQCPDFLKKTLFSRTQEGLIRHDLDNELAWFLTFAQFLLYLIFAELQRIQRGAERRKTPFSYYAILGLLQVIFPIPPLHLPRSLPVFPCLTPSPSPSPSPTFT